MANVIDNCNDINSSELLCQAAIKGDTNLLQELLKRDPLILQRPPPSSSSASNLTTAVAVFPLNLACKYGNKEFVFQLLSRQPDLFEVVDPYDQSSTPLHIACRNGHHEVVKYLVSVNPTACFLRDNQGRNPVHVAAARGHYEVLKELAKACPHALRERTVCPTASGGLGDTALHVCVKHNQLEALKLLVNKVGNKSMLNAGDANGNTILHIAVTNTDQLETVRFLLDNKNTNINTLNTDGLTPMDVYSQEGHKDEVQLKCLLQQANALRSVDVQSNNLTSLGSWVENKRNTLMVVASLLCTIAFQGGINPPGGVWQDDSPSPPTEDSRKHTAGISILESRLPSYYHFFLIYNTFGLASSMCCILILISGLPFKKFTAAIVMVTMWIALGFMMAAYFASLLALTPPEDLKFIKKICYMNVWWILFILTILGHFIRVIVKLVKKLPRRGRSYWLKEGDEQTGQRGAP